MLMIWMPEGLMERTSYSRGTEDYVDILVAKSFFQESIFNKHYFIMHGLAHKLAFCVMSEFGFILESNTSPAISEVFVISHIRKASTRWRKKKFQYLCCSSTNIFVCEYAK